MQAYFLAREREHSQCLVSMAEKFGGDRHRSAKVDEQRFCRKRGW